MFSPWDTGTCRVASCAVEVYGHLSRRRQCPRYCRLSLLTRRVRVLVSITSATSSNLLCSFPISWPTGQRSTWLFHLPRRRPLSPYHLSLCRVQHQSHHDNLNELFLASVRRLAPSLASAISAKSLPHRQPHSRHRCRHRQCSPQAPSPIAPVAENSSSTNLGQKKMRWPPPDDVGFRSSTTWPRKMQLRLP